MPYQNISAVLAATDVQAIRDAIASINTKLPFLITLTSQERVKSLKMPETGPAYLQKVLAAVKGHPEIVPPSFNVAEFEKDVTLVLQMTEILGLLTETSSAINDTLMALGGEAMRAGNTGYDLVKAGAKTIPGLKPVAADIGTIYKNRSHPKPPTP